MANIFDVADAGGFAAMAAKTINSCDDLPFVSLVGEGMPPLGPDFIAHAIAMGDTKPKARKKKSETYLSHGPVLEQLYRKALYETDFYLQVKLRGKEYATRLQPGHRWGPDYSASGPQPGETVDVMVVGKLIGSEEVRAQRNFVGPTSELLMDKLLQVGLTRDELKPWYVTNLIRHENFDPTKKAKAPASWIHNCGPLLAQELRLLKPKFVLCLGTEASEWFMGDEEGTVSASRGRVLKKKILVSKSGEEPAYHEFEYMTCLHPAAVSRSPELTDDFVGTLRRFAQLVRGQLSADGSNEKTDYASVWTEMELSQLVDDIIREHKTSGSPTQPIALDCEWEGEFWSSSHRLRKGVLPDGKREVPAEKGEPESWLRTVQFSHRLGFGRTIVLRHGGRRALDGNDRVGLPAFVPGIEAVVRQLKRLFTSTPDRVVRLVGHNLRADLPWLYRLDKELGQMLIDSYEAPEDDEGAGENNRLFGWQKTRYYGGFDTLYALAAINETGDRKLEVAAMNYCGLRRYDDGVQREKAAICKELKIAAKALQGYGEISDETLLPYSAGDVDATLRLYYELTRYGGQLDRDMYGRSSWKAFWLFQAAQTGELEMEMEGLLVDHKKAEGLTAVYKEVGVELEKQLQELVEWIDPDGNPKGDFNPRSVQQVKCVLFGPEMAGKIDNNGGEWLDPRPEHAKDCQILRLTPVKSAGKPSLPWERIVRKGQESVYSPSTDKESLGILFAKCVIKYGVESTHARIVRTLRWYRFINRVVTGFLCPPDSKGEIILDEDGDIVFDKGFMACVEWDCRVRTHFLPVETGRVSSAKPNCQAFANRREKDLKEILADRYTGPLRGIITARPGYLLVSSDFSGAELLMMAIQFGSLKMAEHCLRGLLPESDPNYYDIHSRVAKAAFRFDGPPLKSWLEANELIHLRDIAKNLAFGLVYSRGDDALIRAIEELGISVTTQDLASVKGVLYTEYPELEPGLEATRNRAVDPGYLVSWAGRSRRFMVQDAPDDVVEEAKREAGNFLIQGGVADVTRLAIRNLKHYPGRDLPDGTKRYYLNLQVHDDVVSEVRIQDLRWYIEKVLPDCLTKNVTVHACDLDGRRVPGTPEYHFGYDKKIYKFWGQKLTHEEGLLQGVEADLLPAPKK